MVREMDATGKVDGVFKKMNMLRAREEYEARADKGPAVADGLSALIESAHSAKPSEAREKIMKLFAGPYLELFAREQADGWTSWGDELKA